MVEQHNQSKASSTRGGPPPKGYGLRGFIRYDALLPKSAELEIVDNVARLLRGHYGFTGPELEELLPMSDGSGELVHHYTVTGTLGTERADVARWKEPPHEAFANLRAADPGLRLRLVDTNVAQNFIKTHGVICGKVVVEPESEPRFYESSAALSKAQGLLRRAWAGDSAALKG